MQCYLLMKSEKIKVALVSVLAAVFLTTSKLVIGLLTGSLGLLSEALHSGVDLLAAGITYVAILFADEPADSEHHYGHGKVENLSAFIETLLLVLTCVWIVWEASRRLWTGETHIETSIWAYVVITASIFIDVWRSRALYRTAKKYNSQALEADALHFSTDCWSSAVVLLGLIFAQFGMYVADSLAALGVAVIVLYVSYRLGKKSIDVLLDKAPIEKIQVVQETLASFPQASQFHDLKVRTAGADTFVQVHIHLDGDLRLTETHAICERIEKEITSRIDRCEACLRAEPLKAE